ncbi:CCA tRNA nucleotidyltransferase, mitochondrial [Oleoguttula sp. CCFEE 5521]
MRLMFDLDLYFTLFCDPTVDPANHYTPDTVGCRALLDELETLLEDGSTISQLLLSDKDERYLAWMLAALLPYRDAPDPQPSQPGRKPPPPVPSTVAREGVKATNRVCDVITAAQNHRSEIKNIEYRVDAHRQQKAHGNFQERHSPINDPSYLGRDTLGMAIRKWGPSWRSQIMYSLLVEMVEQPEQVESRLCMPVSPAIFADKNTVVQRRYNNLLTHLRDLDLLEACSFKPLLDGKQLAKALNTSPGVWMKEALDVVMAWQLRNPDVKDPTEAIEEVRNHGELTSSLLTVRPLFAKSKPDNVTEQGRKKNDPGLPPKLSMMSNDAATTPWKSEKNAVALDLLAWSVQSLDAKTVEQYWHLLVPPILTLIDDIDIRWKLMGIRLLCNLLNVTPSSLLERTGLAPVFEDALMPCLLHLPSLTPESDSTALLSTTYPALLALARLQFPITPNPTSKLSPEVSRQQYVKRLDHVLRKGILHSHAFCSQYPGIVKVLYDNLTIILWELGIDSVKHTKYTLPLLRDTLSHPPVNAAHEQVLPLSTVMALQALIQNAWPRMVEYRGEVLKGLVTCWLALQDSILPSSAVLAQEMKKTVQMLKAVVAEQVPWDGEVADLIKVDGRLTELLQ